MSEQRKQAVNTSTIITFDTCSHSLDIGLWRLFPWMFVLADIPCDFLVADFFAAFDLLVDCRQSSLHDQATNLTDRGISSSDASCQLALPGSDPENPFRQLLAKYPALTLPNFNASIPPHDVVHHIRTIDPPVFSRPQPSRACTSCFRQDFAGVLFGRSVFSKIHLVRAFHQIPIAPEDVSKKAVTTTFGFFQFLRMPFRLRNSSKTFQRFVDRVLYGLPFVYAYIDDLLVVNSTTEEHLEHLATVFDRLQQFGVVLNPSKCVLGVPSLEVLGHLVDSQGIRPLPSKVAAIRDFALSTSKRQLQRLFGMVNCYRRFLAKCADNILHLTSLLSGSKRNLELTPAALTPFGQVKALLADDTLLTHFL
nr:unnamed protein product [Spirometra erinaceieuropaei]